MGPTRSLLSAWLFSYGLSSRGPVFSGTSSKVRPRAATQWSYFSRRSASLLPPVKIWANS